jgi:hypothetical protein
MDKVRSEAFRLRLEGKSYNEIRAELAIPKSTLSGWFKNLVLSEAAKKRLKLRTRLGGAVLIKRNKMQTRLAEQRARHIQQTGEKGVNKLTKQDLSTVGAALYWAEGYKRLKVIDGKERMNHTISMVNADPDMVKVFVRFLTEILTISAEDIRLSMRLYAHINEKEARSYWSRASGLPHPKFFKTTYLISGASKRKRPYNRLPYGTLHVEVCDTAKFHYLMGMISGMKAQLARGRIVTLPG